MCWLIHLLSLLEYWPLWVLYSHTKLFAAQKILPEWSSYKKLALNQPPPSEGVSYNRKFIDQRLTGPIDGFEKMTLFVKSDEWHTSDMVYTQSPVQSSSSVTPIVMSYLTSMRTFCHPFQTNMTLSNSAKLAKKSLQIIVSINNRRSWEWKGWNLLKSQKLHNAEIHGGMEP